jgi:serine/threonine-protein kinase RsbT
MRGALHLEVKDEFEASRAPLQVIGYCQTAGFGEVPSRMIATAVSELVRNILKYAGTGEIYLRQVEGSRGRGVEIEAVDDGPGIEDLEAAMRDHSSTGGTLGLGLPGVERMMDEFSLDSAPGKGTRVKARKWI